MKIVCDTSTGKKKQEIIDLIINHSTTINYIEMLNNYFAEHNPPICKLAKVNWKVEKLNKYIFRKKSTPLDISN